MSKKISFIVAAALSSLCLSGVSASAQQNLRGAYFLDGYTYGYKLNPSKQGDLNFISFPSLGSVSLGTNSNVGISTFLYPDNADNLNTFLSPKVSANEFLSKIKDNNVASFNTDMSLFAVGFRTKNLYHTIDLSAKASFAGNLPGSMMRFMKSGDSSLEMKDIILKANGYAELSYGLSGKIGSSLTLGGRLKFITGALAVEGKIDNASITANEQIWKVDANGSLLLAGGFAADKDDDGYLDYSSIGLTDVEPSYGAAFDLGFTWKINDNLILSGAILDLGSIGWNNIISGTTPNSSWTFEGFDETDDNDSLSDQIDQIGSDLLHCFKIMPDKDRFSQAFLLAPTAMLGLEIPIHQKFSAGILGTAHFENVFSWYEGRVSANYAPGRVFSVSGSAAASTYGASAGLALNFHPKVINIFLGTDNFLPWTQITPQGIPVKALTTSITLGVNFAFGHYNGKFGPRIKKEKHETDSAVAPIL